jgi:hypothetical protein
MSGALHLDIFEQPAKHDFFNGLLGNHCWVEIPWQA